MNNHLHPCLGHHGHSDTKILQEGPRTEPWSAPQYRVWRCIAAQSNWETPKLPKSVDQHTVFCTVKKLHWDPTVPNQNILLHQDIIWVSEKNCYCWVQSTENDTCQRYYAPLTQLYTATWRQHPNPEMLKLQKHIQISAGQKWITEYVCKFDTNRVYTGTYWLSPSSTIRFNSIHVYE